MIEYDRDQIDPDRDDFMDFEEPGQDQEHDAPGGSGGSGGSGGQGGRGAPRTQTPLRRELSRRQAELPKPLYRLLILHSSETLFAHFEFSGAPPHFRTMEQLEAMLEGPIAGIAAAAGDDSGDTAGAGEIAGLADAGDAEEAAAGAPPDGEGVPEQVETQAAAPEPADAPFVIPERAIVVAPTRYGRDLCEVQGVVQDLSVVNPDEVASIEKPAGLDELRRHKENLEREAKAYVLCRQKIWARNLPMKLVSAHYMLDEPKILFYFSAETRVDFRELVKDLVSVFKMRIELRQIGVRDEARVTGGCGVCGRILCCRGVSDKLNPVSIKMAKDQNLSLNSLKISGPCGRLLCCLAYEYQFYRDARRELPNEGARFHYDGTQFRVMEVIPLSGSVKMAGEDGRMLVMKSENFAMVDGRWQIKE